MGVDDVGVGGGPDGVFPVECAGGELERKRFRLAPSVKVVGLKE